MQSPGGPPVPRTPSLSLAPPLPAPQDGAECSRGPANMGAGGTSMLSQALQGQASWATMRSMGFPVVFLLTPSHGSASAGMPGPHRLSLGQCQVDRGPGKQTTWSYQRPRNSLGVIPSRGSPTMGGEARPPPSRVLVAAYTQWGDGAVQGGRERGLAPGLTPVTLPVYTDRPAQLPGQVSTLVPLCHCPWGWSGGPSHRTGARAGPQGMWTFLGRGLCGRLALSWRPSW